MILSSFLHIRIKYCLCMYHCQQCFYITPSFLNFLGFSRLQKVGKHVLGDTPLRNLPGVDLIRQFIQETMHLIDGGVIKLFHEIFLHSTRSSHSSRIAVEGGYRMAANDFANTDYIIRTYAAHQIEEFPSKLRQGILYCSVCRNVIFA